jgi:hypothetical protein
MSKQHVALGWLSALNPLLRGLILGILSVPEFKTGVKIRFLAMLWGRPDNGRTVAAASVQKLYFEIHTYR